MNLFWSYGHKTFEYEFVLMIKKKTIRTLYQINTLFWLDSFGLRVPKLYLKQQSAIRHIAPLGHIIRFRANQS
jgi:hypothetical protein